MKGWIIQDHVFCCVLLNATPSIKNVNLTGSRPLKHPLKQPCVGCSGTGKLEMEIVLEFLSYLATPQDRELST